MADGSPSIRIAGAGDGDTLTALVAAFRDTNGEDEPSNAQIKERLGPVLADPANELCCAWLDGEPVGYTWTRFMTSLEAGLEAHLEDLFVVSRARGRAIGRALLRHALARARARGALELSLNTNEHNREAQALYRSEGLEPAQSARFPGGRELLWTISLEPGPPSPPGEPG